MAVDLIQSPKYVAVCDRCMTKCPAYSLTISSCFKVAKEDYGWKPTSGTGILCPRCAKYDSDYKETKP